MNIFQKLVDGANKATDYAQQTMKITKINTQIADNKREIERNCSKLGIAVYEAYKAGDVSWTDERIRSHIQDNLVLEREIAGWEQEVEKIKNEKECDCGKKVSADTKFCPDCGKRLYEDPVEEMAGTYHEVDLGPKECKNCFEEIEADARFCEKCGSAQRV